MKITTLFGVLLFTLINANAVAATLIQSLDAAKNKTNIYIEGQKAHIEMPRRQGYLVMDVSNKSMKAVIHKQRAVLDMSDFMQPGKPFAQTGKYIDTYTKTMGLGPKIIGYETEEYGLYANDQYCGSLYVSVEAMRDIGLKKFAHAFVGMQKNFQNKISSLTGIDSGALSSPCMEAQRKASLQLRDIGFPLKSINKNKHLISIVTDVHKNAILPANAFVIPADYQVMNPAKMINDAMKQMNPQMREMMRNMSPETQRMMQQKIQEYQKYPQ